MRPTSCVKNDVWWVLETTDWPEYVWRCGSEEEACNIFVWLVEDLLDEEAQE